MKKTFLALALTGLLFTSCKKETETPEQTQQTQQTQDCKCDCKCDEITDEEMVLHLLM